VTCGTFRMIPRSDAIYDQSWMDGSSAGCASQQRGLLRVKQASGPGPMCVSLEGCSEWRHMRVD
jgi:hypothetical protein